MREYLPHPGRRPVTAELPPESTLRPLTDDDYQAAQKVYNDWPSSKDRLHVRFDVRAAVDAIHARLAADCEPAPQPPAVVLPTVDEAVEAVIQSMRDGGWTYRTAAQAVLDLIAGRVTPWQPVEPGATIKAGTRYRCETVDGESTEGTYRLNLTTHEDGWFIDPRTVPAEPEDPRVAVLIQWWRGSIEPMATDKDAARDLLARLDALGDLRA